VENTTEIRQHVLKILKKTLLPKYEYITQISRGVFPYRHTTYSTLAG